MPQFRKKPVVEALLVKPESARSPADQLLKALRSIANFRPDLRSREPYQDMAVFSRRTARDAVEGYVGRSRVRAARVV